MAGKSQAEIAAAVRAYVPTRLTVEEQLMMARAPRKPGTQVTVRSYPAVFPWSPWDHMYEEYDDGREQYIYRGGPVGTRLNAQVTPARQSPDYGRGKRVLDEFFLPGVSARDATNSAQQEAQRINRSNQRYEVLQSNSNEVIGNHTAREYGRRVGDARTPGYRPPELYSKPRLIPGVYPMTMPIW